MAKKSKGVTGNSFPKWETPMSAPVNHPRQEPYIGPDNGPAHTSTGKGMFDQIVPGKSKGYNIGTGGKGTRWYR